MRAALRKRVIAVVIVFVALGAGVLAFVISQNKRTLEPAPLAPLETKPPGPVRSVIGKSVEGRDITAYHFGTGATKVLFVGGMHGGYEWNSVLLAYTFMDYLDAHPGSIPQNLTVTVIPSANPDGVYKVIDKEGRITLADVPTNTSAEPGRFNAHGVDLNRNFDCKWKPEGMWRGKTVSGGSRPFSEPEAAAIRSVVLKDKPGAVIFWHSQANAVYASECENGILPGTLDIMNAYSRAAGYPAVRSFDQYEVTGDAEGWLSSISIPAITVELKTHEDIEWERNLAGIKALFEYFGNQKE